MTTTPHLLFYNVYVDRATKRGHMFGMQPRTSILASCRAVKEDGRWLLAYRIVCRPKPTPEPTPAGAMG